MNDFTLSESTSVSFDEHSRNKYTIHYKLHVNNGECHAMQGIAEQPLVVHEKKLSDISTLENLDLWQDIREIDELIETNKDCFVSMRK